MLDELKNLIKNLTNRSTKSIWWIDRSCPYTDYCKEIVEPGTNKNYPEGAVALRVDEDFWAVLAIPYKFKDLSTKEIANAAFPNAKDPQYKADSGSLEQIEEELRDYNLCLEDIKEKYPNDKTQWAYYEELIEYVEKRKEAFNANNSK